MRGLLTRLWQEMADLTRPKCGGPRCRPYDARPHRCCDAAYCEQAIDIAARDGVTLPPTGHPTLLLMGSEGCIAPPEYRPLCTLHVCAINNLGFDPDDSEWTERYFTLRERLSELEGAEAGDGW